MQQRLETHAASRPPDAFTQSPQGARGKVYVASNRYGGTTQGWSDPARYSLATPDASPQSSRRASPEEAALRIQLRGLFDKLDEDGSGLVSSSELRTMVDFLQMDLNDAQLNAMLTQADPNGDGQLSFEEFIQAIHAQKAAGQAGGLASVAQTASNAFGWINPFSWFAPAEQAPAAPPQDATILHGPSPERGRSPQSIAPADRRSPVSPSVSAGGYSSAVSAHSSAAAPYGSHAPAHPPRRPKSREEARRQPTRLIQAGGASERSDSVGGRSPASAMGWVSPQPFEPRWGDGRGSSKPRPPPVMAGFHERRRGGNEQRSSSLFQLDPRAAKDPLYMYDS